jgi:hypothetical protein
LTENELEKLNLILVNGIEMPFTVMGNLVILTGDSKYEKPLSWQIEFK